MYSGFNASIKSGIAGQHMSIRSYDVLLMRNTVLALPVVYLVA